MGKNEPVIVPTQPRTVAVVRETVAMDSLVEFYDRAFNEVAATIAQQGMTPAGPAVGVYFGSPGATADVAAGFPVDGPLDEVGNVKVLTLPGGRVAQLLHAGSYERLGDSYDRLFGWLGEQGEQAGEVMWETYLTEPSPDKDPESMKTLISWTLEG